MVAPPILLLVGGIREMLRGKLRAQRCLALPKLLPVRLAEVSLPCHVAGQAGPLLLIFGVLRGEAALAERWLPSVQQAPVRAIKVDPLRSPARGATAHNAVLYAIRTVLCLASRRSGETVQCPACLYGFFLFVRQGG